MDLKRDYYEDTQLWRTKTALVATLRLGAALVVMPFMVEDYTLYILNFITINYIVGIGLNVLVGYTGQISLEHAGFFAVGAYICVLLVVKMGILFLVALPAAKLVSALFGFIRALLRASSAGRTTPDIFTFDLGQTKRRFPDQLAHTESCDPVPRTDAIAQAALEAPRAREIILDLP